MSGQAIVTIRDKQWDCWVASAPEELATGLSGVPGVALGTGMLFILPQEQIVTVSAENMLFPLSVIFIGENFIVTEVAYLLAPGDYGTTSLPCRYFLEVNENEASGIESGDPVDMQIALEPGAPDWASTMMIPLGFMMMVVFMVAIVKGFARDALAPPKEKPFIYGPRGELLSPQTRAKGKYEIDTDYMGNIIITRTDDPDKDVFLQFEADKSLVYDLLKKGEKKDLDAGWSIKIKRSEPRASILDELWESSVQPQSLPQTRKRKPARHDVEIGTWVERDRIGIWLTDKRTGKTIAEWWDEDAREMFEQGWFNPGDIRRQTITGRAFEESVLEYTESVGLLTGGGKYMAQTVRRPGESVEDFQWRKITGTYNRDTYYWTAMNKDTGEIVESLTPYTSSGRALRGGKAYASRHWRGDKALVEVWRQPYRYSENLKIQPAAAEMLAPDRSPAVIPTEPHRRRPRKEGELEFLPDSPEFLAYTIDDIGYREKLDTAFQNAIRRAKGLK